MSITFSGVRIRTKGLISAISKQCMLVNLKPLTKITIRFDPFFKNVEQTRDFLFHLSGPKIAATNLSCLLKTEIICDRSEPIILCSFENKEELILKSANLTTLELLTVFNKHVSSRVKPVEAEETLNTKKRGKKR